MMPQYLLNVLSYYTVNASALCLLFYLSHQKTALFITCSHLQLSVAKSRFYIFPFKLYSSPNTLFPLTAPYFFSHLILKPPKISMRLRDIEWQLNVCPPSAIVSHVICLASLSFKLLPTK